MSALGLLLGSRLAAGQESPAADGQAEGRTWVSRTRGTSWVCCYPGTSPSTSHWFPLLRVSGSAPPIWLLHWPPSITTVPSMSLSSLKSHGTVTSLQSRRGEAPGWHHCPLCTPHTVPADPLPAHCSSTSRPSLCYVPCLGHLRHPSLLSLTSYCAASVLLSSGCHSPQDLQRGQHAAHLSVGAVPLAQSGCSGNV